MWIELHDTLSEHRKTEALAQALGVNQAWAVGILAALWTWSIRNAPTGDLSGVSDKGHRPGLLLGAGRRAPGGRPHPVRLAGPRPPPPPLAGLCRAAAGPPGRQRPAHAGLPCPHGIPSVRGYRT